MAEDLKPFLRTAQNTLANTGKVTFMHLVDTFIQSDLQCIQVIHFWQYVCSLGIEPSNFCAANAMLYHWATGTGSCPSSCNIVAVLGFALANNRYFPQKTYKSSLISSCGCELSYWWLYYLYWHHNVAFINRTALRHKLYFLCIHLAESF